MFIKLKKESEEYFVAQSSKESLKELADMLEVIRALAVLHGATWEEIGALREKKEKARGWLTDNLTVDLL